MTRYDSSSLQAVAEGSLVAYRTLVDLGVTSGTLHFVTGKHATVYASNTYTPVAGLGYIEPVEEDVSGVPRDITLGLCGVNTLAMTGSFSLYEPLRESMLNRPVRLYRQFLDPDNLTAVHTPEPFWKGKVADVEIDLENGTYEVRAATSLRKDAKARYFNRETITQIDSSDTFADWVDAIPTFKGEWGGREVDFAGQRWVQRPKRNGQRGGRVRDND